MSTDSKSVFLSRFDHIWAQARRVQLSQALCWAILTLLAGIALLAAADYWLELPLALRLAAIAAVAVASVAVAISLGVQSVRRWQRQATAATIEKVFPQLGQRIRTTVQYSELSEDEVEHEGVATTLVTALSDDTVRRAEPLPLDAVVPWKSLAVASLLAAVVGLGMAGLSAFDWQWRAAAKRAFLANDPYTRLTVDPGNVKLKEGESTVLHVTVEGRTGKQVTLAKRRTDKDGAQWETVTEEISLSKDPAASAKGTAEFELDRVKYPLEYKVTAGSVTSETYKVEVLYPLKIVKIESTVQPPEYTRQGPGVSEGGNISGLAGSQVQLAIELDRPASEARIELSPISVRRDLAGPPPAPQTLPVVLEGNKLAANLALDADLTYTVFAKSADGMELPENKYRIRVRQDEPPQVWFESPAEALEVTTLAEIIMRIRVSDDFGLSRSGVMFVVNNEEEYPLIAQDFAEAAKELETTGTLTPQTRATLEKLLPLEHFELTQQDSVMYYAFAEDIRPGSAQRTESDLRFIDIRPFRRTFRVFDNEDGMGMGQGSRLKSLEELIGRQRYALNRSIQIDRRFKQSGQADLSGVDSLVKFQGELAKFTRELAEGLQRRGVDDTELLFQAEASMLAATDSLSAGSYETATQQERDALKYLIEGRIRIEQFIAKNPNRQQLANLRSFDRMQRQKLRRPKSDEQEAKEVAERLEQLADTEDFVYLAIGGLDPTMSQSKQPVQDPPPGSTGQTDNLPMPEGQKPAGDDGDKPMPGDKPAATGDKPMADGQKPGEGEPTDPTAVAAKGPATREELEDKQSDVAAEAREIEKVLGRLNGVTDLAKERIAAAAKVAEEGAEAIARGKMDEARGSAGAAREQFRELAKQVKALLAEEQADRIAAAQQLANELARQQQEFTDRLAQSEQSGGIGNQPPEKDQQRPGVSEKPMPNEKENPQGLGGMAQKIAEGAKTLADALGAAARADTPQEQETGKKVDELVKGMGIGDLTERLKELPNQVGQGKMADAKATTGDGADRLEAAAEALGLLHRSIVAPKVDELAKIERELANLDQRLDQLDTPTKITGWHMDADELQDELDNVGVPEELRKEFIEEMKRGGWGDTTRTRGWNWGRTEGGYYAAPGGYRVLIARMQESIRNRMQELLLGDLASSRDEPIPPQYQEFVDRYYQVLAAEGREKMKKTKGAPSKD
ncbi:MAG: hypothetical protein L0211_22900 [Planctomycetaceae bacterium]|nr:hypothetical protein [Planctomycetaceae bacterium]